MFTTEKQVGRGRVGFLVLGMHRSGTSAVAGLLAKLGVRPPATLLPAAADNPSGFWESAVLVQLHNELLERVGSRWNDWRRLDPKWIHSNDAADLRQRAIAILAAEFGDATAFVLKDPRICRFAWFWLDILGELGISAQIVLPFRSPLEVAQSLHARNGHALQQAMLVWLRHILDAEEASRGHKRVFIEMGRLLDDWRGEIARIGRTVSADFFDFSEATAQEIDGFLDKNLHNQRTNTNDLMGDNPEIHPSVILSFQHLRSLVSDPKSESAQIGLDSIRTAFDQATSLLGGPFRELEELEFGLRKDLRDLGQRHDALSKACEAVQAQCKDNSAGLDSAREEVDRQSKALREMAQKHDEIQEQIAVLTRERDTAVHNRNILASRIAERDSALAKAMIDKEKISAALVKKDMVAAKFEAEKVDLESRLRAIEDHPIRTMVRLIARARSG